MKKYEDMDGNPVTLSKLDVLFMPNAAITDP